VLYTIRSIQQEEGSPHQQIRLRAKEETSEVLHLEHMVQKLGLFGN
jgi:hypothetical protein